MRWHTTHRGTLRAVKAFAWVPQPCTDGTTRWLELVVLHQMFMPEYPIGARWRTEYAVALEAQ